MNLLSSPSSFQAECPPPRIVVSTTEQAVGESPIDGSARSDAEHRAWLDQQYLRDLETLDRIERQREEVDPCFFCAMGDIAAGRALG